MATLRYNLDEISGALNKLLANCEEMRNLQVEVNNQLHALQDEWASTGSTETYVKLEEFISPNESSKLSMFCSTVEDANDKLNSAQARTINIDEAGATR